MKQKARRVLAFFVSILMLLNSVPVNAFATENHDHSEEEHTHSLIAVEAKEESCQAEGNRAYWYCECNKFFSDAEGTNEIAGDSWVIPAAHTTILDETVGYWVCTDCSQYFEDETATKVIDITQLAEKEHTHSLIAVEAKEESCQAAGNRAYWYCECNKFFSDAEGTNEIAENSWVIPAAHATILDETVGYWVCTGCGQYFEDEAATKVIDITQPAEEEAHTHSLEKIDAVEASCTLPGRDAYYRCTGCGLCFESAESTEALGWTAQSTYAFSGYTWDFSKKSVTSTNGENSLALVSTAATDKDDAADFVHKNGYFMASYESVFALTKPVTLEKSTDWTVEFTAFAKPGNPMGAVMSTAADDSGIYVYIGVDGDLSLVKTMELNGVAAPTYFKVSDADYNNSVLGSGDFKSDAAYHTYQLRNVDGTLSFWLNGVKIGDLALYEQTADRTAEANQKATGEDLFGLDTLTFTHVGAGNGLGFVGAIEYLGFYTGHAFFACGATCVNAGCTEPNADANGSHTLTKTDAVAATCTTSGNIEYWTCDTCGCKFSDAEGTQRVYNVTTDPVKHNYVMDVAASVEATCNTVGIKVEKCTSGCGDIKRTYTPVAGSTAWDFTTSKVANNSVAAITGNNTLSYAKKHANTASENQKCLIKDGALVADRVYYKLQNYVPLDDEKGWTLEFVARLGKDVHEDDSFRGVFSTGEDGKYKVSPSLYFKEGGDLMLITGYQGDVLKISDENYQKLQNSGYDPEVYHLYQLRYENGSYAYYLDNNFVGNLEVWSKYDVTRDTASTTAPTAAQLAKFEDMVITRIGNGSTSSAVFGLSGLVEYLAIYPTGHTYSGVCDTTCNAEGCNHTRTVTVDHIWDDGVNQGDEIVFTCSVCQETKAVPAGCQHSVLIPTVANAKTCTTDGNIAYWTCDACDMIFSDAGATTTITAAETVIPASHGEYVTTVLFDASCYSSKVVADVCKDCGAKKNLVSTAGLSGHVWDFENETLVSNNGNTMSFYKDNQTNPTTQKDGDIGFANGALVTGDRVAYKLSDAVVLNRSENWTMEITAKNSANAPIRGVFTTVNSKGNPSYTENTAIFVFIAASGDMMIGRGKQEVLGTNTAEGYWFYCVSDADFAKIGADFDITQYHNFQLRNEKGVINYYLDGRLIGPLSITRAGSDRTDATRSYVEQGCAFNNLLDSITIKGVGVASASTTGKAAYGLSGETDYMAIYPGHSFDNACDTTCNHVGCTYTRVAQHDYATEEFAPTFEADGYTVYTCKVTGCNYSYTDTHEGTKLTAVAKIDEQKYVSLEAAVAAADGTKDIVLMQDVTLTAPVVAIGKTVDFAGKTLTGTFLGTMKLNGGNLVTAEGYKMIGSDGIYYRTNDAVFSMDDVNGSIKLISGTTTLVPDEWWTLPGQTLTIGENATFIIPEGKTLQIRSQVIVEGTIELKGTVNLHEANATVQAAEGMQNITTTAGDRVLYVGGKYIVHSHDLNKTEAKAATCLAEGNNAYWTCQVSDCAMTFADAEAKTETTVAAQTLEKLEHRYGDPAFSWTWKEAAENYDVTAAFTCSGNGTDAHTSTKNCAVEKKSSDATCVTAGTVTYTATVSFNGKDYQDTKTNTGTALGHRYDYEKIAFAWSADLTSATATVVCPVCVDGTENKILIVDAQVAVAEESKGDCQTKSYKVYKAVAAIEGNEYTDSKRIEGNLGSHSMTKTAAKAATCAAEGNNEYWYCSICKGYYKNEAGTQVTTLEAETLEKLPHTYGDAVFTWNQLEAGKLISATITCSACPAGSEGHILSGNVNDAVITVDSAINGDCKTKGSTTYLAVITINGKEYKDKHTVEGEFGNHSLKKFEKTPATCVANGHEAYWHCDICDTKFADEACTEVLDQIVVIPMAKDHVWDFSTNSMTSSNGNTLSNFAESATIVGGELVSNGTVLELSQPIVLDASDYWSVKINAKGHGDQIRTILSTGPRYGSSTFIYINKAGDLMIGRKGDYTADNGAAVSGYVYYKVSNADYEANVPADFDVNTSHTYELRCEDGKFYYWLDGVKIGKLAMTEGATGRSDTSKPEYTQGEGTPFDFSQMVMTYVGNGSTSNAVLYGLNATVKSFEVANGHSFTDACDADCNVDGCTYTRTIAHVWGEGVVTKEPTDLEEGVTTYTCKVCGATDNKTIPALGHTHNITEVKAKDPNCEEAGNSAYWHCTGCGIYFGDPEAKTVIEKDSWIIAATDHKWGNGIITKAPTDGANGEIVYTCQNAGCGKTSTQAISAEDVAKIESYAAWDFSTNSMTSSNGNALTNKVGTTTIVNGELVSDKTILQMSEEIILDASKYWAVKIEGKGHDDSIRTILSTGTSYSTASFIYINRNGDMMLAKKDGFTADDGTAVSSGYTYYKVSDADFNASVLAAGTYDINDYHTYELRCENGEFFYWLDGVKIGKLALTEQSLNRNSGKPQYTQGNGTPFDFSVMSMKYLGNGNSSGDPIYGLNATVKSFSVATGHVFSNECDETCNNAGCSYKRDGEHTWDAGKVTTEATQTQEGVKTYTCSKCSGTKTEVIPILPHVHDMNATAETEATCNESGNTAYWTCKICGKHFADLLGRTEIAKDSWIVDAKGHDWDEGVITKQPTNKEDGERTYTCKRVGCGETKTEPVSAAGEIVMKYDDRLAVSELGQSGAPTISSQTVRSKKVGTNTLDDAVIAYVDGKLIAVGVGTAILTWGTGEDAVNYNFVVEPAMISLIMVTGHSLGSGSQGNAGESIICEDGQVYCTNERAYAFKLCTGSSDAGTVEGKDVTGMGIGYGSALRPSKIDALNASGAGVNGADSAIAYRWTQLTGEKVWVLNSAKGSTNLSTWQKGGYNYRHAVELFTTAEEILYNESLAGHYKVNKLGIVNYSTANGDQNWTEDKYITSFNSMWDGFRNEMAVYDFNGDNVKDTVDCLGVITTWSVCSANQWDNMHKAPLTFLSDEGVIRNGKLSNYHMSAYEDKGVILASVAGRSWTNDADVKAYFQKNPVENMYGKLQNGSTHTSPSTVRNGVYGDGVHYCQLGYNVQGIEAAESMYNYWYGNDTVTSVKLLQFNGIDEVPDSIEVRAGESYGVVPVVEPACGKLSFKTDGDIVYENAMIKGVAKGEGTLTISTREGQVLRTIKVKVTEAKVENYDNAQWYVWDFAEGKLSNTAGSGTGNALTLVKSDGDSVSSASELLKNGTLSAQNKTTMGLTTPVTLKASENWFVEVVAKGTEDNAIRAVFSTSKALSGSYIFISANGDMSIVRKGSFVADDNTTVPSSYTYYKVSDADFAASALNNPSFDITEYHTYQLVCTNGVFSFWLDGVKVGNLSMSEQSAHRNSGCPQYTQGSGTPFDFSNLTMSHVGCGSSSNAASQGVYGTFKKLAIGSGVPVLRRDVGLDAVAPIGSISVYPGTSIVLTKPDTGEYCAKFIGWTENQDGSGKVYAAGSTYTVSTMAPVTLYGNWEARDTSDALHTPINGICTYCGAKIHTYTEKVAAEEYLCTKASYDRAATYYYSCSCCGGSSKGTIYEATFEHGRPGDGYYSVVSETNWDLAPGIVETELVLNNGSGDRRQVVHVMEVDITDPYVTVMPSYMGMNPTPGNYQLGTMTKQTAWVEKNMGLNVVGAMNTSLSWYDSDYYQQHPEMKGEPTGVLVIDGTVYSEKTTADTCLVINYDVKNGSYRPANMPKVELRYTKDGLTGWEQQVIPCNFGFIVKDGVNSANESHENQASKSILGVKADGTIVLLQNDGRLAPYSSGMSVYEAAEAMINLGCVYAVRCDGGGTSTYLSQRPGEELKVNNTPSDGVERTTTTGIMVITTAPSDGSFARASITAENNYYAPGCKVSFTAVGTDLAGTKVDIPEDAVWQIKETDMGSISKKGVFTSNGTTGKVTAQLVYKEKIVGECVIEIVIPEEFRFQQQVVTVPFGKTINLPLVATVNNGLNIVTLNPEHLIITTDNAELGAFDGIQFTAVDEDKAPANLTSTVTAKIASVPGLAAQAKLNLGRGSEIIEDFEDSLDDWEIVRRSEDTPGEIVHADSKNGFVYDGKHSAGMILPNADQQHDAFEYNQFGLTPKNEILLEGAVSVGAWVYVPDDFYSLWIRLTLYTKDENGEYTVQVAEDVLTGGSVYTSLEHSGWYYFSVDVSKYESVMIKPSSRFIQMVSQHCSANELLQSTGSPHGMSRIYIDNITVDYSDAADDREPPIIQAVTLDMNGTEVDLLKHAPVTTTSNVITVKAMVTEDELKTNATGLDPKTAKAFIDGEPVVVTFADGVMSVNNVALADGMHRVHFEISDYAGNTSTVTRLVNVKSGVKASTIEVVPADPSLDRLYGGSVYWMNVNATMIQTIQEVSFDIDLNAVNHWELDHMEVAEGFTATYSVDEVTNTAHITITRTSTSAQTGKQTLASLPIRVIYYDTDIANPSYTAETFWKEHNFWPQDVAVDVDRGVIQYVPTYTANVHNTFSNEEFSVDTEFYTSAQHMDPEFRAQRGTAHVHDPKPVTGQEGSCTEDGIIGRTHCDICDSVVEWGTVVKAEGHNYKKSKGVMKCKTCGVKLNGELNGKHYIDGVIADGWITTGGKTYYYVEGVMITGNYLMDGKLYVFGEDGVYDPEGQYTGFYTNENGKLMYFVSSKPVSGYQRINNESYWFHDGGLAYDGEYIFCGETCLFEGGKFVRSTTADLVDAGMAGDKVEYVIYADGTMVLGGSGQTYNYSNHGNRPFLKHAINVKKLVVGENITRIGTYFMSYSGVKTVSFAGKSNLAAIGSMAFYESDYLKEIALPESLTYISTKAFGNSDKLEKVTFSPTAVSINDTTFNGSNKVTLYVTEDSDALAYAIRNEIPYVIYDYSAVSDGFVEIDGVLYYYQNGEPYYAGLIQVDGAYYYVRSNGQVVCNSIYWVTKHNDLLPPATYTFGIDGRMLTGDENSGVIEEGLVYLNNTMYYYRDFAPYYAGLIEIGDDYYYVRSSGEVAVNCTYWITKTNDLLPVGNYTFHTDGKMVKEGDGIVDVDGTLYYYHNGAPFYAGLISVDDQFYYVRSNGQLVVNRSYWITQNNGLLPEGNYAFGPDGKMQIERVITIEEIDGVLYCYRDGQPYYAGLFMLDGNYYYARSNRQLVVGCSYWVSRTNGLLPEGNYTFDETGKLIP